MPVLPYRQAHPTLGDRVLIAPNAYVIGDVVIGADTSVWFGTVIRGDVFPIKIGSRSNIQDNSVVHVTTDKYSATIGDDVTVGHRVILHGCTVEDGALIGMGAIVMDRAHIGKGALVAAGTALAYLPAQPLFPTPAIVLTLAAAGLMVVTGLRETLRLPATEPSP